MNKATLEESLSISSSKLTDNLVEQDIMQGFVFIPYNKKWGVSQILGDVRAMISLEQKCIVKLSETTSYLYSAIMRCVSEGTAKKKKAMYVTFDAEYNERYGCYVVDKDSFQLFYGDIKQLGILQQTSVFVEIPTFVSPEGQVWTDEEHYEEYANQKDFIYECSDGSLTKSYADFKIWEKELALRPHNPNYEVLPYQTPLSDIEYEVANDGTIWRDKTILDEYLGWRTNPNQNYNNGYYCGAYGVAESFKEYAKKYNAGYFLIRGLRRREQYLDSTYNFLFTNQELADSYINRLKSFQKKI